MAQTENNTTQNAGLWGGIAAAVTGVYQTTVTNLVPKARDANVAIAEANARAAEANAKGTGTGSLDPKVIWIGLAVLVLIGIIVMATKK